MKKNIVIFFSGDIMSAIFASIIFAGAFGMVFTHFFFLGIRGMGLFLEVMIAVAAWGLVKAVYSENRKEYLRLLKEKKTIDD